MERPSTVIHSFNKLLGRKDKTEEAHKRSRSTDPTKREGFPKPRSLSSGDVHLAIFNSDGLAKLDRGDSKRITAVRKRFEREGFTDIDGSILEFASQLTISNGDVEKIYEMALMVQDSTHQRITPYSADVKMLGAENRNGVTCYLDALLFAMFAKIDNFLPMLSMPFDDEPRKRLAFILSLWVNMLRTGKLIQVDITKRLQDALAACGWEEAALVQQQDTSEAFSFITGQLGLPLLSLKMDIYHSGTENAEDDHRIVNERLLEVAVPEEKNGGKLMLEECLDAHFHNRIEVFRRLERSSTGKSLTSPAVDSDKESIDGSAEHVEVTDTDGPSPTAETPANPMFREGSLIRKRVVSENGTASPFIYADDKSTTADSGQKGSLRREVLMPAWQFFNLLPWSAEYLATSDPQLAAQFSKTKPVIGICLKRYGMDTNGKSFRRDTKIDIPLQIALPNFINEGSPESPRFGERFKVVLQSIVCHRGDSVQSGHYVSLVRATPGASPEAVLVDEDSPPGYSEDRWLRFDDLADERVSYVDIEEALNEEVPYLVFYQVQPLFDFDVSPPESESQSRPPSYQDASRLTSEVSTEVPSTRVSFSDDVDRPRGSPKLNDAVFDDDRRGSVATDLSLTTTNLRPVDPTMLLPESPGGEESPASRMSRAAGIFGKSGGKSRSNSQVAGDGKSDGKSRSNSQVGGDKDKSISSTLSRMTQRKSRERLSKTYTETSTTVSEASEVPASDEKPRKGIRERLSKTYTENSTIVSEGSEAPAYDEKPEKSRKGKTKAREPAPDRECAVM